MSYDPISLNSAGLWRVRIHCLRALSAAEDPLQGMMTSEDDYTDSATARVQLSGAKRSIEELMRHFDAHYDVNNFIDGQGRGSLDLKEDSCLLLD
jgi:hypothetical protein